MYLVDDNLYNKVLEFIVVANVRLAVYCFDSAWSNKKFIPVQNLVHFGTTYILDFSHGGYIGEDLCTPVNSYLIAEFRLYHKKYPFTSRAE